MLHPVIMAGGSGTRFWPRSRLRRPKQLIQIVGRGTMIQQTFARLRPAVSAESFLIITNAAQAETMRRQLPELNPDQIVAEPVGRDTAAAIGLAAVMVQTADPDAIMVVLSADHVVQPADTFLESVNHAARIAAEHKVLVTFGIKPAAPSTHYGYIRRGAPLGENFPGAYRLAEFKEKPDRPTAERYLASGEYYWNSGNFVWRATDILQAFRTLMPDLYAGLQRIRPALGNPAQQQTLQREYPTLPKTSIDYGIMEKAANSVVLEARFQWDDIGAWDAIARHYPQDQHGNTSLAQHVGLDTRNCILVAENGHLIATAGVEDLIIVQTPDATLVCDRHRAADVKDLVALLKTEGRDQFIL